jgi:hypothetical protein
LRALQHGGEKPNPRHTLLQIAVAARGAKKAADARAPAAGKKTVRITRTA